MSNKLEEIAARREALEALRNAGDEQRAEVEQAARDEKHDKEVQRIEAEIAYEEAAAKLVAQAKGEVEPEEGQVPVEEIDKPKTAEEILAASQAAVDASRETFTEPGANGLEDSTGTQDAPKVPDADADEEEK